MSLRVYVLYALFRVAVTVGSLQTASEFMWELSLLATSSYMGVCDRDAVIDTTAYPGRKLMLEYTRHVRGCIVGPLRFQTVKL